MSNSPWRTIDPKSLTPEQGQAWAKFQAANKAAGEARKSFEAIYTKGVTVPDGYVLKLSYRYGLGVALLPEGDAKSSGGKKVTTLADYLAAHAA